MIKEAGFLWSAAMGNLLLCVSFAEFLLAAFLYQVSGISVGFCEISACFPIIHKSVDKCTENPFNNFLITCGISTFPYLHPRDYGYPQGY